MIKGMNGCCKLNVLTEEPTEHKNDLPSFYGGGILLTINKNNKHYDSYTKTKHKTVIPLTEETEIIII